MANIRHFLKDGTEVTDIKGHLVTREDAPRVYALIEQMNAEREKDGHIRSNQRGK